MESRVRKLEKNVSQQVYLLLILMFVLIFNTATILLLWNQAGTPYSSLSSHFQTLFGIAALYGFWSDFLLFVQTPILFEKSI